MENLVNMKIGITGSSGNLGSYLFSQIASIKNHLAFPISSQNFNSEKLPAQDLDVVIHAATCYGRGGEKFSEIMSGNLVFPLKILELMGDQGIFINIDTVLEDNVSAYSFSKGSFRKACQFLIEQGFKGKIINVRLHSFYGLTPSKSDLIYNLTRQFLQNITPIDLTKCEQKRDFIFIEDVVSGVASIVENLDSFPAGFSEVDIGSGRALPLKDIVMMIKEATKSHSEINFGAIALRRNEPMNLCADITKMQKLNWHPTVSIEEGITKIINSIT